VISILGRRLRGLHLAALMVAGTVLFSVFFMGSVTAYVGTSPFIVSLTKGKATSCSGSVTIAATVRDAKSGKKVAFQEIDWGLKDTQSSKDKISPRTTHTNGNGQSSVTVSFGSAAGTRIVTAAVGGAKFITKTTASCSSAGETPGPKPTKKPKPTEQPTKKPKPTPTPTQKTPRNTPEPTPRPTKKPKPTQADVTSEPVNTEPSPTELVFPSDDPFPTATEGALIAPSPSAGESSLVAIAGGSPGVAASGHPLTATDTAPDGGGGGGFDLGLIALLVIGALGVLVVIFLIRQPARGRR
jgi:hypothetical protein